MFELSLMRLGSKHSRLWNVSYLSTSCIIVLTKALLFEVLSKHISTGLLQTNSYSLGEGVVKYYSSRFYLSGTIYDEL